MGEISICNSMLLKNKSLSLIVGAQSDSHPVPIEVWMEAESISLKIIVITAIQ
jgi:uncharacterized phosphosugar-binding protein